MSAYYSLFKWMWDTFALCFTVFVERPNKITMICIAKAMHSLPVGFAYSTYSGLTVVGVVFFAILKYNQVPNIYGLIGIILIIIGVVMVNYLGKLN